MSSSPQLSAVTRSPLTEQVVDQITDRILSGELPPGMRLRQRQLADELSVSRTPLREALQVLRNDGLVSQRPNGSFTVIAPTIEDARDTYEMRAVVDAFAARKAAERATPAQIAKLGRLVDRLEETHKEPLDARAYLDAVTEFHVGLLEASGNQGILALEKTIRMSTHVLYPRLDERRDRFKAASSEHRRLFEAIRDGQPDEAERLAREHVEAVIEFWLAD